MQINKIMSKKQFCEYIRQVKNSIKYDEECYKLALRYNINYCETNTSHLSYIVCELLDSMFDTDNVSFFCFDLNFGETWQPGDLVEFDNDGNGIDIDISTAEKLYDYLASKNKGG